MTDLRDKIAIAAMAAIISKTPYTVAADDLEAWEIKLQETATGSYEYADAMIKASSCK